MKDLLHKQLHIYAIGAVILLIGISVTLFFWNKAVLNQNATLKRQTETVQEKSRYIIRGVVQRLDVGVRGYALTKNEKLLKPVELAEKDFKTTFDTLQFLLQQQNYPHLPEVTTLKNEVQQYITFCKAMAAAVKMDSVATFQAMFAEDRGTALWYVYEPITKKITEFETALNQQADQALANAHRNDAVVQLLLLLLGVPLLGLVIHRFQQLMKSQSGLLERLAQNNRRYLFHPGAEATSTSAEQIIESSIHNFRQADILISAISEGNYNSQWEGLTQTNTAANDQTLAGKLTKMKERMQEIRQEEEKRIWATEGLAQFSEKVRNHQNDTDTLVLEAVKFLVKYLNAQQGGIFVALGEGVDAHLELAGCYAFDRRKFVSRQIKAGEGLVGQAYLEAASILLTDVPQGYTTITSGLGDATPACLLLVPMKYNGRVEAVFEIASFQKYEPHQVEFLEKAGEFVASALVNAKNTAKMQNLLDESRMQAEAMQAQEEELRQNLEELAATQEEMLRQERERLNDVGS